MSEETRCQQVWIGLVAHINARMMIFGVCVQTVRRRCRQFRNKCFGYNFSPREQIAEVPDCTHFEQLIENAQLWLREAVVQVPRVDVHYVDKERSSSHGGDRCTLWDRSQERD